MHTRQNLTVSLVLAISMVGISYGVGGDMGAGTEPLTNGSAAYPYLIEDLTDFDVFADSANAAIYWAGGVHTKLTCDPNLAGRPTYTTAVIAPDGNSFEGIFDGDGHIVRNLTIDTDGAGNDYLGLFGEISGSGAAVKNLGIENTDIIGGDYSVRLGSLCGYNSGTITNCYSTGSVIDGRSEVGGLCGCSYSGTIGNCHATGSIIGRSDAGGLCGFSNSGTITNCYATCSVSGKYQLGGLCGENNSGTIISNCYAVGSITGETDSGHLGGLCGLNRGTINNCYAAGSATGGRWSRFFGGLCGENEVAGTISNCYATGSVIVGEDAHDLGGLCGYNEGGTITGCFWDIETGGPDNGIGAPKTTTQMQTRSTFTDYGWDFTGEDVNGTDDFWRMCVDGIDYPKFSWQFLAGDFTCPGGVDLMDFAVLAETWYLSLPQAGYNDLCDMVDDDTIDINDLAVFVENWLCGYNGGNGSAGNPFRINTPAQLNDIGNHPEDWDKHFVLTADIDMADYSYTTAVIGSCPDRFTGSFDGAGFIISNLTIDTAGAGNYYLGLFSRIDSGGEVKNLGVENVNITGGNDSVFIGGLCGYSDYCTITNCYAVGSVTGDDYLGGLCGKNDHGTITNCYAACSVTGGDFSWYLGGLCGHNDYGAIVNCYAAGSVTGEYSSYHLGGLCGYNEEGTITNCYATGSVTGGEGAFDLGGLCGYQFEGTIANCYATGSVTGGAGSSALGGLCGHNNSGTITITNCYATGSVTGGDLSGGLGGLCGYDNSGTITITNCYATGSVTGGDLSGGLGGLCGYDDSAINNCFWDVETSGMTDGVGNQDPDPAGVMGKTTAEMQIQSTFTDAGWDFVGEDVNGTEDIWDIEGTNYPNLSWQFL